LSEPASSVIFTAGSLVQLRVRANNNVGLISIYSPILSVTCDNVPQVMTDLYLIKVHPGNMTIGWQELTSESLSGGDLPIFYSVEFSSS
jgi:hypothetical protein